MEREKAREKKVPVTKATKSARTNERGNGKESDKKKWALTPRKKKRPERNHWQTRQLPKNVPRKATKASKANRRDQTEHNG